MHINRIDLLEEKHLRGERKLKSIQEKGTESKATDLARLLGVNYNSAGIGDYWYRCQATDNKKSKGEMYYVMSSSFKVAYRSDAKSGVRIAIALSEIEGLDPEKTVAENIAALNLEYPQTVIGGLAGETIAKLLETNSDVILRTGKIHDIAGQKYNEYEIFGTKFIRMHPKTKEANKYLTNGEVIDPDKEYYLRIEPISFTLDEDKGLIYSHDIISCSIYDSHKSKYENSQIYRDLNGDFLRDLNNELLKEIDQTTFRKIKSEYKNRYGFDFKPLTEEEIIEICINCNIAVFLHGKTGTGKTERMLTLDRDLELIDFGCTSADGFTGIIAKDYNSQELKLYEPYWYKSLCKKCAEKPNKIHILFLEELTNAKSDIQKVAFEVTLAKTLTNSGFRLHLPKNAVVCAAGNESDESKSASPLSEPLFGRFAHVYIDTDSESWIHWALDRKKNNKELLYRAKKKPEEIHPAIIEYIKIRGNTVLRTPYNGKTPNADPRKWALASQALYECGNPQVLRAFVGKELTQDFIKFSQLSLISVEDIIMGNADPKQISTNADDRWAQIIYLTSVDDEHVDIVRDFLRNLDKEYLSVFDYEWSKNNPERVMRLYTEEKAVQKRITK